jgi:allophanate hydrolase subunit 2
MTASDPRDALREAAQTLIDNRNNWPPLSVDATDFLRLRNTLERLAALAGAATPPALDVERLHGAMLTHWEKVARLHVCVGGFGSCASDIAAEYARLSTEPGS